MVSRGLVAAACAAAFVQGGLLSKRHEAARRRAPRLKESLVRVAAAGQSLARRLLLQPRFDAAWQAMGRRGGHDGRNG